jgi:hypothetical protein
MSAHLPPPASPTPPCEPEDELSYQADSNYNGEVGNSDGDVGNEDEEQESTTYPPDSGPAASNAPLPRATIPHLLLTQQVIDTIKNGNIHDDIQNPDVLKYLNNPPKSSQPMDASTTLSIRIFEELILGSQKMYDGIRDTITLPVSKSIHTMLLDKKLKHGLVSLRYARTCVQRDASHTLVHTHNSGIVLIVVSHDIRPTMKYLIHSARKRRATKRYQGNSFTLFH